MLDIPKGLVVEGLITNSPGPQTIHLSSAIPFDSSGYVPESGAMVYVTDNNKMKFYSNYYVINIRE